MVVTGSALKIGIVGLAALTSNVTEAKVPAKTSKTESTLLHLTSDISVI